MPIPGDNGQPKLERDKQNARIREVSERGADCQKDVIPNAKAPKEKCIFGEI
jgi:hypothetical protein